jgi:RNA polymerase sigma-70 factor, ECF subfamily
MVAEVYMAIAAYDRTIEDRLPAELAADLDGSFERLVLTYQDRLYSFARRLSGNAQDAEEIAQDTFVRAYRALCGYAPDRIHALALRPWLYQIATNVFRNRVRGHHVRTTPLDGDEHSPAYRIDSGDSTRPDVIAERTERARELGAHVQALPDRYRAAVVLRHIAGFNYHELAGLLGQPVGTIKANVHRGTRLLRESLQSEGYERDR